MHRKTTALETHRSTVIRFVAFAVAIVAVAILGTATQTYRAAAETAHIRQIGAITAGIYRDEADEVLSDYRAANAVTTATAVLATAANKVDAAALGEAVTTLSTLADDPATTIASISRQIDAIEALSAEVTTAVVAFDQAAAEAAAAAAAAQAAANTVAGAQNTARTLGASQYGWDDGQFACLVKLWTKESNWNFASYNPSSGAGGIPQALPASKMATAGADWQSNASTQVAWGLAYISRGYGTPCSAWSHSQAVNWY
jgi:hypothetical protein